MKTFLYIDGCNLYYSALKDTPLRWLDPVALASTAFPRNRIVTTKFFTAKVTPLPHDPRQPDRQQAYWRALRTLPALEIIEGDFRTRKVRAKVVNPPPNTIEVNKTEEKGSDVNLGAHHLVAHKTPGRRDLYLKHAVNSTMSKNPLNPCIPMVDPGGRGC